MPRRWRHGAQPLMTVLVGILTSNLVAADSRLHTGEVSISANNGEIEIRHRHEIVLEEDEAKSRNALPVRVKSKLAFVRLSTGETIREYPVPPFTHLVNVDGGPYFVGMSYLQLYSQPYNFMLFHEEGRTVAKALVTARGSSHCNSVSASTTNYIYWFDQESPQVYIEYWAKDDTARKVLVKNPFDQEPEGGVGECVLRVP